MKIKHIFSCILVLFAILTSGCTHNDGDIGEWFGSWHLEQILINGEPDEEYATNQEQDKLQVMVSFQSSVFFIGYIGSSEIYGSWSYAGETLTLIADTNSVGYLNPNYLTPFPKVLGFPEGVEQVEVTVTNISGKTMQWQFIDPEGRLRTYNFRKYP